VKDKLAMSSRSGWVLLPRGGFFPLSEVAFMCVTRMTVMFRLWQAQHGASSEHGETIQPCSPMTTKSVPVGGA